MPDSHCPTKTLSVHGDIWPDQPDVPAEIAAQKHSLNKAVAAAVAMTVIQSRREC